MYKLRLGVVLLKKYLLINVLVVIQLLVILIAINFIIVFSSHASKFNKVFGDYADANFFKCVDSPRTPAKSFADVEEFLPEGTDIFKTTCFGAQVKNEVNIKSITSIDNGLLTKLKYKPIEGRWFNEGDSLTGNAVMSYNTEYSVGDTIKGTYKYLEFELTVIGILKRGENELNLSAGTTSSSFFAKNENSYDSDYGKTYVSRDFFEQYEGLLEKFSGSYANYFKLSDDLPFEEYLDVLARIEKDNYFCFSAEQLKQFDKSEQRVYSNALVPITILLFVMALLGFLLIALITIKTSAHELGVIKALGGDNRQLMQVLACYIGLPMIFMAVVCSVMFFVIFPLGFKILPFSYINYIFTFSAIALFFLLNFTLLGVSNYMKNKKRRIIDEEK